MREVCVVHLVWAPLGPAPLERFIRSYRAHGAGLAHRLVLLFNGFTGDEETSGHRALVDGLEHETLWQTPPSLDLPAYGMAAATLDASHLCFLNSHSALTTDGWLAALADAYDDDTVGAVGATGSYESPHTLNPLRRRRWPGFPNPHLRTNALFLSREVMRGLRWPPVRTKAAAWELESGRRGLTRQVWETGRHTLVVGRDGRAYPPQEWPHSATFRSGAQRTLLVSDNRTRQWADAEPATQARLSRLAWAAVPRASASAVSSARAAAPAPVRRRRART